jgi:hypothetical protein
MSSLRWLVKRNNTLVSMHRYESEAVKSAMFYNDEYQTDEYYIEKFDKKKAEHWLGKVNDSQVDGA